MYCTIICRFDFVLNAIWFRDILWYYLSFTIWGANELSSSGEYSSGSDWKEDWSFTICLRNEIVIHSI